MQVVSDDYQLTAGRWMSVVQASRRCRCAPAQLLFRCMRRRVPGLLLCAFFALMADAPMARADATDDAFIAALQQKGVTVADRDAALAAGHSVCATFGQGATRAAVVRNLLADGFSAQDAGA
jgi:Protein of unknown function (DUF732)